MTFDPGFRERLEVCGKACLAMLLALAGCGGDGPPRFDLSGMVSHDGAPVPAGYIEFAPDTTRGNSGPGASADIHDGRYSTLPGLGTIGGPHVVTIRGFDGVAPQTFDDPEGPPVIYSAGEALFTAFEARVDLPKQTAVHDFVVPKQ